LIAFGEERLSRTSRRRSFLTSQSKGGHMEWLGWIKRSVKGVLDRPTVMAMSRRVSNMRLGLSLAVLFSTAVIHLVRTSSVIGGAMSKWANQRRTLNPVVVVGGKGGNDRLFLFCLSTPHNLNVCKFKVWVEGLLMLGHCLRSSKLKERCTKSVLKTH